MYAMVFSMLEIGSTWSRILQRTTPSLNVSRPGNVFVRKTRFSRDRHLGMECVRDWGTWLYKSPWRATGQGRSDVMVQEAGNNTCQAGDRLVRVDSHFSRMSYNAYWSHGHGTLIRAGLDLKKFTKWYCSKFRYYLTISVQSWSN
jgi:hypothetical protein